MPIVTLTGRIGAPASPLGLEVAHQLGADYIDNQIMAEASRRSGASLEAVSQRDERTPKVSERLARFFQKFLEKSAAAGSAGDPFLGPTGVEVLLSRSLSEAAQPATSQDQELDDKRYIEIITSVIQDLARGGNVVIIGRGSHVVLREMPNALHVYLVSNLENRTRHIQQRDGVTLEAAEKFIKDEDPQRVAYYKKLFKVAAEDPELFHLFLNVDNLGMEHSVTIIAQAAREMDRQGATV